MAIGAGLAAAGPVGYRTYLFAIDNFHEVAAGELYRSAQPSRADLAEWRDTYGIRTVINLRGAAPGRRWYDDEVEDTARLGLTLIDLPLSSDVKLSRAQVVTLMRVMKDVPKPALIHCNQGVDRTGLAAALYLAGQKGADVDVSDRQLGLVYGHVSLWFIPAYAMDESWEESKPLFGFDSP